MKFLLCGGIALFVLFVLFFAIIVHEDLRDFNPPKDTIEYRFWRARRRWRRL